MPTSSLVLFLAILAMALPGFAQDASLAGYDGPDRAQKLIAAAQKEGSFALYTTFAEKDLPPFRDLVAGNGLSVRSGHPLLTNLVASGEVPLALTVYQYSVEQAKKKGSPIDWFAVEPAVSMAQISRCRGLA